MPYYEWGCALGTPISTVLTLLQNEEDFRKLNEHSLKLENTVFENFQAPIQTIQVSKNKILDKFKLSHNTLWYLIFKDKYIL